MTIPMLMAITGIVLAAFGSIITILDMFGLGMPARRHHMSEQIRPTSIKFNTNHVGLAMICIGAALLIFAAGIGHFSN
jgi:hypothetical protein